MFYIKDMLGQEYKYINIAKEVARRNVYSIMSVIEEINMIETRYKYLGYTKEEIDEMITVDSIERIIHLKRLHS